MHDSVLVSLLPVDGTFQTEFPHLTLCWAGRNPDDLQGLIAAVARVSANPPFRLVADRLEVFGKADERVSVLTFHETERLLAARSMVEPWSASEYEFRPHVTLGPVGDYTDLPEVVEFNRLQLKISDVLTINWPLTEASNE